MTKIIHPRPPRDLRNCGTGPQVNNYIISVLMCVGKLVDLASSNLQLYIQGRSHRRMHKFKIAA